MNVKIKLNGQDMPEQHGEWVDLATAEDVTLVPGEFKIISLGVVLEVPDGYYTQIVPRSSTCKKWGVLQANSIGIIERNYCGEDDVLGFPAVAIRKTHIPKGTRICQMCVKKTEEPIQFIPVESMSEKSRGGFGSTGD